MKLPSIKLLLSHAQSALLRFPGSIFSSIVFACVAINMIEQDKDLESFSQINLLLSSLMGISLFFLAQIVFETYFKSLKQRLTLYALSLLILVSLFLYLPGSKDQFTHAFPYIRYLIFLISIHLIIAVVPFIRGNKYNGFWNYNKLLFIRIIITHLFSTVLATGLLLALGAIRLLFDVKFDDKLFPEIYVLVFTIFNTWFFVSNIPEDLQALENQTDYPSGLKVFSQYILLPLLLIYLLILYAYGGKIMLSWEWPKGVVSYLILCISVVGGLTFLLLYPYANTSGNQWIKNITKWYYLLLTPLLFLLFFAIFLRLDDYGITLNRYVILMFGIWVSIVSVYTILGKINIRFIPVSLVIILLLSSFGPWSMDSVPKNDQQKRLETILTQAGIMKDGKIIQEMNWPKDSIPLIERNITYPNDQKINDSLRREVISILQYLDQFHGCEGLDDWFTQNMDSLVEDAQKKKWLDYRFGRTDIYLGAMGLSSISESEEAKEVQKKVFTSENKSSKKLAVTGFDEVFIFNEFSLELMKKEERKSLLYDEDDTSDSVGIDLMIISIEKPVLIFKYKGKEHILDMTTYLKEWEIRRREAKKYPSGELKMVLDAIEFNLVIQLNEITAEKTNTGWNVERMEGLAFMKVNGRD
jgi:Domain of unknown function (DUF4153)